MLENKRPHHSSRKTRSFQPDEQLARCTRGKKPRGADLLRRCNSNNRLEECQTRDSHAMSLSYDEPARRIGGLNLRVEHLSAKGGSLRDLEEALADLAAQNEQLEEDCRDLEASIVDSTALWTRGALSRPRAPGLSVALPRRGGAGRGGALPCGGQPCGGAAARTREVLPGHGGDARALQPAAERPSSSLRQCFFS